MPLLICLGSLIPLMHVVLLHSYVVVCDREHRVLLLGRRVAGDADASGDQLQCALGVLHGLVVLVQLRQDRADVEVCASHGRVVGLQGQLNLQRLAQVTQRSVQLADLFVIAPEVVARHCEKARGLLFASTLGIEHSLGILQLLKGLLVLPLSQEVHSILVASEHQLRQVATGLLVLSSQLRAVHVRVKVRPKVVARGDGRSH
mmetsp:Transcript_103404/g.297007  ORF Transcript_103404/g.297007 Transcript_103404/m.297007 type:complete len:203 (+) Transcript_103404:836-1444(+)